MKTMWCWRCQQDMPMLDEVEFASVDRLWRECFRGNRRELSVAPGQSRIDAIFEPVRREYERLTGFANCPEGAVMHHRIALYGPDCGSCGKPLRTPEARHCAACGAWRSP